MALSASASSPAKRRRRWLAALFGAGALAALGVFMANASPADLLNRWAPSSGYDLLPSLAYGDGPRRTVDVYRPEGARDAPVIVFFYGGSWQTGTKETFRFVAAELASRGFVTIVPDYRVYPEVKYPGFLEDGAAAIAWARDHAASFGGDPRRIVLMGHSAGAYMAAMLAIDETWLAAVGMDLRRDISGLVGLAGPYDFLPLQDETLKIIFGGANRRETLPIEYVKGSEPPSLLITGGRDRTVDPRNSERLAARLLAEGSEARAIVHPWHSHLSLIGAFGRPMSAFSNVPGTVDAFIRAVTATPLPASGRPGS